MDAKRYVAAVLTLLVLWLPSSALAARRGPVMLRMEGFAGEKPAGVTADAQWTVSMRGERTPLTVVKLQVVSGGLAYYQVVNALSPYPTAFSIKGAAALLDMIAASSAEHPVLIVGALTMGPGARILQVGSVEAVVKSAAEKDDKRE